MTNTKPVSETIGSARHSLLLVLAFIVLVLVIAVGLYLVLQRSALLGQNDRLNTEIVSLESEISALEAQKVEAAQSAQKWLDEIEDEEIKWSRVITRIQSLVPYSAVAKGPKIGFLSYSGSQGGRININAQSQPARRPPYSDVSELISIFSESSSFSDAYVPTITRSETDLGDIVLSFIFNVTFDESAPIRVAVPEETEVPEEADTTDTELEPETTT